MRMFKRFLVTACDILVLMGAAGLILPPSIYGKNGPPPAQEENDSPGQGDEHRADPCDRLPDPRGKAKGHDKKCPPLGSSSGIAKGDFNGDGIGDLAIGVPNESVLDSNGISRNRAGAVNIIYGSATVQPPGLTAGGGATGVPLSQIWHQNSPGILGEPGSIDFFGSALAAGDFNGDNVSDLAIGVPGEDSDFPDSNKGAVQVLFGSTPNGLTSAGNQLFLGDTLGLSLDTQLGSSLAWGDFNGDTVGDLAIGGLGFVLVFRGQSGVGLRAANFQALILPVSFSPPVLTAGKFNSDTRSDLAVGIPFDAVGGSVHVFYGSSNGLNLVSGVQVWNQSSLDASDSEEPGDSFGAALAAGDFNCDSISDLAIGVPHEDLLDGVGRTLTDAGAVNVIYGSSSGLTATGNQFWHQDRPNIEERAEAFDNFGAALAAGNFDGFGCADLAIGVPLENFDDAAPAVLNSGAVNVIYGQSGSGLTTSGIPLDQFFHQNTPGVNDIAETGDSFGSTLTAWDFSGDGAADLAIGVPLEDVITGNINIQDGGQVQVLYGSPRVTTCCPLSFSPGGLTTVNDQIWHQNTPGIPDAVEANDQFGSALY